MLRRMIALVIAFTAATSAAAHPVPNLRYDRTAQVRLAPDGITIRYVLDISDWTLTLDPEYKLPNGDFADLLGQPNFEGRYAERYANERAAAIAEGFQTTLNGEFVQLRSDGVSIEPHDGHRRFTFTFRGKWLLEPGKQYDFRIEDQNWANRSGRIVLAFDAPGEGVQFLKSEDANELWEKSPLDLTQREANRLRLMTASFKLHRSEESTPILDPPVPTSHSDSSRVLGLFFLIGVGLGFAGFAFGIAQRIDPRWSRLRIRLRFLPVAIAVAYLAIGFLIARRALSTE